MRVVHSAPPSPPTAGTGLEVNAKGIYMIVRLEHICYKFTMAAKWQAIGLIHTEVTRI